MATQSGKGHYKGAIRERTQFQRTDGHWQKRDETGGQFMEVKQAPGPFKSVAKEPDGRDGKD